MIDAPPITRSLTVPLLQAVARLTDALLEQCQLWREHGWEWWPVVPDPPAGKALRSALTMLRARIQGGKYQSAHLWLNRQRADGQLPRQIFEGLAADPQAQEWPELLIRIQ